MSSKGLVNASIINFERAIGSRESNKNCKNGTFRNKMYYESLSLLIGNPVRLKYI